MTAITEILLALLAVVGLLSIGFLAFGRLLSPAGGGGSVTVLPGRGDGGDLEQAVRGAVWLRCGGVLAGRILIVDCGLTPEGRAVAQALCRREPELELVERQDLAAHI